MNDIEVCAMARTAGVGFRGYIGSRAYSCGEFPQNVQNMIIRNYCQKHGLTYLLSATEYAMPGCYMILEEVVNTIDTVQGIAMFSIFMLPTLAKARHPIYIKLLKAGRECHFALEDMSIRSEANIQMVEDILRLNQITAKSVVLDTNHHNNQVISTINLGT